jgi:hypothetical protein
MVTHDVRKRSVHAIGRPSDLSLFLRLPCRRASGGGKLEEPASSDRDGDEQHQASVTCDVDIQRLGA